MEESRAAIGVCLDSKQRNQKPDKDGRGRKRGKYFREIEPNEAAVKMVAGGSQGTLRF